MVMVESSHTSTALELFYIVEADVAISASPTCPLTCLSGQALVFNTDICGPTKQTDDAGSRSTATEPGSLSWPEWTLIMVQLGGCLL